MKKTTKPVKPPNVAAHISNTLKWIPWIWLIITIPLMGFQAAFHNAIEKVNPITGEVKAVWNIFIKTAPLCTTILLVTIAVIRQWFEGWGLWLFGVATLIILTMFITPNGREMIGDSWQTMQGNSLFGFQYKLLTNYFILYEWQYFLSSWLLGISLGWLWAKRVIPLFKMW